MERLRLPIVRVISTLCLSALFLLSGAGCLSLGDESNGQDVFDEIFKKEFGANPTNSSSVFLDGTTYLDSASPLSVAASFTVGVWVKPSGAQTPYASLVDADVTTHFFLGVDQTGGAFQFAVKSAAPPYGAATGGTVQSGAWKFLVGTYDGATAKLYVNGALVAQDTFAPPGALSSSVGVGAQAGGGGVFWNGNIDEVAIWNKALPAAEVQALYSGGKPHILAFGTGNYKSQDDLLAWWTCGDADLDTEFSIIDLINGSNLAGNGLAPSDLVTDVP